MDIHALGHLCTVFGPLLALKYELLYCLARFSTRELVR